MVQSTSSAADNYSANEASPRLHWTNRITMVVTEVRQRALPAVNPFQSRPWKPQISQIVQAHVNKPHLFRPIPILSSHPRTGFRVPLPPLPTPCFVNQSLYAFHNTPLHATCTDYLIISDSCYCLYYWGVPFVPVFPWRSPFQTALSRGPTKFGFKCQMSRVSSNHKNTTFLTTCTNISTFPLWDQTFTVAAQPSDGQ
jgi:hypothetical protein